MNDSSLSTGFHEARSPDDRRRPPDVAARFFVDFVDIDMVPVVNVLSSVMFLNSILRPLAREDIQYFMRASGRGAGTMSLDQYKGKFP